MFANMSLSDLVMAGGAIFGVLGYFISLELRHQFAKRQLTEKIGHLEAQLNEHKEHQKIKDQTQVEKESAIWEKMSSLEKLTTKVLESVARIEGRLEIHK